MKTRISRANSASVPAAADLVDPQDRQEGAARDAAGQQRAHDARRFAVGVRLPGVHGGQAHLGAVADESSTKAAWSHGGDRSGASRTSSSNSSVDSQPGLERGVGQEERAEQGQGDAHRADEQVLPGRLQGAGVVVEVEQRGAGQRGRLHRHPHQAEVVGQRDQRHHRQDERTGSRRRRGWAGRSAGPGSPARRASRGRTGRSGSRGRPCPSGSSSSQPPSARTRAGHAARDRPQRPGRVPGAADGQRASGRQRSDGTANATAAITRGTGSAA